MAPTAARITTTASSSKVGKRSQMRRTMRFLAAPDGSPVPTWVPAPAVADGRGEARGDGDGERLRPASRGSELERARLNVTDARLFGGGEEG